MIEDSLSLKEKKEHLLWEGFGGQEKRIFHKWGSRLTFSRRSARTYFIFWLGALLVFLAPPIISFQVPLKVDFISTNINALEDMMNEKSEN